MMDWSSFEFEYPWMLALLVPLVLLLWWAWTRPLPSVRVPGRMLFDEAGATSRRGLSFNLPFIFGVLGGLLLVVAAAGPRFGIGEIAQKSKGVDILIAIDLSGSMSAYDAPNVTKEVELRTGIANGTIKRRIEVCKEEVKRFIEARPNDRIGVIAFVSQAFAVCPPTIDHGWLNRKVDELALGTIGDGTGIAAPIASAIDRLKGSDARRKVMVLFTDGANNVDNKLTPRQAADIAKTYDITIHTVGIGSHRAFVEKRSFFGMGYEQTSTEFDEPLLKEIAEITGGQYYAAKDADGMRKAMDDIDQLEAKTHEIPVIVLHREVAPDVALGALAALLLAFLLTHTVFLRYP